MADVGVEGQTEGVARPAAPTKLRVGDMRARPGGVASVIQPVVDHPRRQIAPEVGDRRVVGIQHQGGLRGQGCQSGAPCGCHCIHLTIAIKLVAEEVVDEDKARTGLGDGLGQGGFIRLEQANAGTRATNPIGIGQCGGGKTGDQVGSGAIVQHALTRVFEDLAEHTAGGGLAIRATDQHRAVGQPGAQVAENARHKAAGEAAGQRGTAARAQSARELSD